MPGRDRKGPMGEGPMTGRGAGNCVDQDSPGSANPELRGYGMGRGLGRGMAYRGNFGRGRGQRNRFFSRGMPFADEPVQVGSVSSENPELATLKRQMSDLGNELEAIRKLIEDLKT